MKSPVVRTPRDKPTVDDLDGRIGDLDRDMVALRVFLNQAADGDHDNLVDAARDVAAKVEELEAENADLRNRLDKLGDIGQQKTSKEQKIAAIVNFAENKRRPGQKAVTVSPGGIEGAAGVGQRYAYDLVDDMIHGDGENGTIGPGGYDWAHDPKKLPRRVDQDVPDKGVCIDFEGVHGEAVPLNEFNNGTTGMGVAD